MKKNIGDYFLSSTLLLCVSLVFSTPGLFLLVDDISSVLRVLLAIVFIVSTLIVGFYLGRSRANKYYKKFNSSNAAVIVTEKKYELKSLDFKPYTLIFHVLPLFCLVFFLTLLSVLINNAIVHGIVYISFVPISAIFYILGLLNPVNGITAISLAIYLPFTLIYSALFMLGYYIEIKTQTKQRQDLSSEIRSFNN